MRRPPRGVKKSDFAGLNYYDLWFPNLSPTPELVKEALNATNDRQLAAFKRKFRAITNFANHMVGFRAWRGPLTAASIASLTPTLPALAKGILVSETESVQRWRSRVRRYTPAA